MPAYFRLTFTYDGGHRVLTKSFTDGTFGASYVYDQTGVWGVSATNTIGRLVFAYDRHNTATLYSYDVMGRIKRLQLQQDTVSNPVLGTLADHAYSYGTQNNGNVLSVADQLNLSRTQNFTYDGLNRLATANESRWGLSFTYDPWGNFLQQSLTAGYATQHQYVAAPNNRLIGYTYDAAGNML